MGEGIGIAMANSETHPAINNSRRRITGRTLALHYGNGGSGRNGAPTLSHCLIYGFRMQVGWTLLAQTWKE